MKSLPRVLVVLAALANACTFPYDEVVVRGLDATSEAGDASDARRADGSVDGDATVRDARTVDATVGEGGDGDAGEGGQDDGGQDDGGHGDAGEGIDVVVPIDGACPSPTLPCGGACVDGQNDALNCGACGNVCASGPNRAGMCVSGNCSYLCSPGTQDCDGDPLNGCETALEADPNNCGNCGQKCAGPHATATCSAFACSLPTCDPGFADCDNDPANGCETSLADASNCTGCGRVCGAGTVCSSDGCVDVCPPGTTLCQSACTDTLSDANNCGACDNPCPPVPNGVPVCSVGNCSLQCSPGFADCNGLADDGCETVLSRDPNHCGACGINCPGAPNEYATCSAGACSATCAPSYADCDGMFATGCEVNLRTDSRNCGACGVMCPAGAACVMGTCACSPGTTVCGGACVDLGSDPTHCGSCTNVCSSGLCSGGTCVPTCPGGQQQCSNGACVDTANDPNNCGGCGVACLPSQVCSGGQCVCNTAGGQYAECAGSNGTVCTDITTDSNNCGACNNICASGASCVAGACPCATGQVTCDGVCTTLANDPYNCGACGAQCMAEGTVCNAGRCIVTCPRGPC